MMSIFIPFTPEDAKIVLLALNFAKEIKEQYHSDWRNDSHPLNYADIDEIRLRWNDGINQVIKMIEDPRTLGLMRPSEIHNRTEIIGSALKIYLQETEKSIDPRIPKSRHRPLKIKKLLDNKRFFHIKGDLFKKFYDGYEKEQITGKKRLFFSYSSKDSKKVGEICDILVRDYNYDVFRAHDTIKVTQEWRIKIKENLANCDGLVAYITRNFRGSEWVYQEVGWIASRGKPIYSLFIMKKIPDGFIEERQGTRISEKTDAKEIARKINEAFSDLT